MSDQDYYKILNVSKNANQDKIKKNFHKLSLKWHPDKYRGDNPSLASKTFAEINNAYNVLSDPEKRKKYDQFGKDFENINGGFNGMSGGIFDIFNNFPGFGGRGGGGRGRATQHQIQQDIIHQITISFKESYIGTTKNVNYSKKTKCEECNGIGALSKEYIDGCDMCHGQGFIVEQRKVNQFMFQQSQRSCPKCLGEGEIIRNEKKCKKCNGKKITNKEIHLNIPFPPGISNDFKMYVRGHGHHIQGQGGDLIVQVRVGVPPNRWSKKNDDLHYSLNINLSESLCGFKKVIDHIDERHLLLKSINIIKPFDVKKIKGEGMPILNDKNKKGDLYIKFTVTFPNKLNDNEKKKLREALPKAPDVHIKSLKNTQLYEI